MRILAIDPALNEIGIVVYDTDTGMIMLSKTLSHKDKDKKTFTKDLFEKNIINVDVVKKDTDKPDKDRATYMWTSKRLENIYNELNSIILDMKSKNLPVELVVTETQLSDDCVKCVSIANLLSSIHNCLIYEFRPTTWKKILTGKGNIDEQSLENIVKNSINQHELTKHISEHEIDAFGLILTYLKYFDIKSPHIRDVNIFYEKRELE